MAEFIPDGLSSLTEVDTADCTYRDGSVIIQGVVAEGAASGGWSSEDGQYGVLTFSFDAWRRLGQPVKRQTMTILRPVKELKNHWGDYQDYSVIRIRVRLSTDDYRAIYEEALPMEAPDEELNRIAEQLQQDVIIRSVAFGEFKLDRRLNQFEADVTWNGDEIELRIEAHDDGIPVERMATARKLWADQKGWQNQIDEFVVRELLELKNDNWLEEDEEPLTASEFTSRLYLESVCVDEDAEFVFWYDDGELFWGHIIEVRGNIQTGISSAGIAG